MLQATALAAMVHSLLVVSLVDGLAGGDVLWLGFTATTVGVTLYSRRNWAFLWLNSSYFLLVIRVNSLILTAWR